MVDGKIGNKKCVKWGWKNEKLEMKSGSRGDRKIGIEKWIK